MSLLLAAVLTIAPVPHDSWTTVPAGHVPHDSWTRTGVHVHSVVRGIHSPTRTAGPAPTLPHSLPSPGVGAEAWRPLITAHFPTDQIDSALRVVACESGGDPSARNSFSGAAGLFQIMPQWADGRWGNPLAPFDPYDPDSNARFAAWLWSELGWSQWVCQP